MRFWKRRGTLAISPMRGRKAPDAAVGGHSQQRTAVLAPVPAAVVRPCDALSLQGALDATRHGPIDTVTGSVANAALRCHALDR